MRSGHEMPFGAQHEGADQWRFALWAPAAEQVELLLGDQSLAMVPRVGGWHEIRATALAGTSYCYRIDGGLSVPDPASRAQADDVHGLSVLVDPDEYRWHTEDWQGRPWHEAVVYELHVGTFTADGTFDAARSRLAPLRDLGITAIELMPVSDFPGTRDWGYDGVLPFAPDRRYGSPSDLKRFIDEAHRLGMMVMLDVVYNHFGPEGNYLHLYAPSFFTERHHTPWGVAIDFSVPTVREFFIHNALYWLGEYRFDGLRLDAVHAIVDETKPDIIDALAKTVRERFRRHVHLVLENNDNAAHYLRPRLEGHAVAQWNDDFHHPLHVILTGEASGYYSDFSHRPHALLARSLKEGFAFQGEYATYHHAPRGESSADLPVTAFVNFLQNHDQIGNRAFGERLTELCSPDALRAATAILLLSPGVPLLFMGQEWGSRRRFPFFCDFGPELAPDVTEGRRREFARFPDFADPARRALIPDPESPETYLSARLDERECADATHGQWLELHRALIALRQRELIPYLDGVTGNDAQGTTFDEGGVAARWRLNDGRVLLLVANLGDELISDIRLPGSVPLYASPDAARGDSTLTPWAVMVFVGSADDLNVRVGDTDLF